MEITVPLYWKSVNETDINESRPAADDAWPPKVVERQVFCFVIIALHGLEAGFVELNYTFKAPVFKFSYLFAPSKKPVLCATLLLAARLGCAAPGRVIPVKCLPRPVLASVTHWLCAAITRVNPHRFQAS